MSGTLSKLALRAPIRKAIYSSRFSIRPMVDMFATQHQTPNLFFQSKRFAVNFHNWEAEYRRAFHFENNSRTANSIADFTLRPYDKADPPGWFDIQSHGPENETGVFNGATEETAPNAILSLSKPSQDWNGVGLTMGPKGGLPHNNIESVLSVESLTRMITEMFLGADADSIQELRVKLGDDVANKVISEFQKGIPEGANIRMLTCFAGMYFDAYKKYQAQELSTLTGKCIIAANTRVGLEYDLTSASQEYTTKVMLQPGPAPEWRLFVPGGPAFLAKNGYPKDTPYIVVGEGPKTGVKTNVVGDDLEVATTNANAILEELKLCTKSDVAK